MQIDKILVTGGSGLLGAALKKLIPDADFPTSDEFDVTNYEQMDAYVKDRGFEQLFHAAAFTSPPKIDEDPVRAVEANVIGTANVVKLCHKYGIKLIYVSTDYVFDGDKGNYREDDPVQPVNKYAWSKLGGECAARLYDRSLVIRTSFGPDEFPYPKAIVDQWTSRQGVTQTAEMMVRLLGCEDAYGTVHVGGPRRSVFEYAKSLDPSKEIGELSVNDLSFDVPSDTSLDCSRFEQLVSDESSLDKSA